MKSKIEEKILPVVEDFVTKLKGRYNEHCSDKLLTALLMHSLGKPSRMNSKKSMAEDLIEGDKNVAYQASCWIFETILEGKCSTGGNGHHMAQYFNEAMLVLSEK